MFNLFKFSKYNKFIARFDDRNNPIVFTPFLAALNVSSYKFQNLIFVRYNDVKEKGDICSRLTDMQFRTYQYHTMLFSPTQPPNPFPDIYGEVWYHPEYNLALNLVHFDVWCKIAMSMRIVENLTKGYDPGQQRDIFDTALHSLVLPDGG
jgi:hypothetical protein